MSRIAQEMQRFADEQAKNKKKTRRKVEDDKMSDVTEGEATGDDSTTGAPDATPAAAGEVDDTMAKKAQTKKSASAVRSAKWRADQQKTKKKNGKKKTAKTKARAPRRARADAGAAPRSPKRYRLVDSIPETVRDGSAGRKILESIEQRGAASTDDVRADLPKFPDSTIRFYLGKYQRDGIVGEAPAAAATESH